MNKLTYLCDMIYEHAINNQCIFVLTSIFHSLAKCHHTYGSQCDILKEFSMLKKISQDKKKKTTEDPLALLVIVVKYRQFFILW